MICIGNENNRKQRMNVTPVLNTVQYEAFVQKKNIQGTFEAWLS